LTKCREHGLSISAIEDFFRGNIQIIGDEKHSSTEDRYIAVGYTREHRPLFVSFTYRIKDGRCLIRPISAQYMHVKEANKYEKKTP